MAKKQEAQSYSCLTELKLTTARRQFAELADQAESELLSYREFLLSVLEAEYQARLLKKLSRFDGIIIDDIGYVQQEKEEIEVLFTLLAKRYEQGSVMITSNLPFSK